MTTNDIKELVGNSIFTAKFIKKNGEERTINCRLNVKKHLKGGELSHNPEDYNHLIVFDMQKKGYRTIALNTLKELIHGGKCWKF